MTRGGALRAISCLADCVSSVVYKSTLPRVLVAKHDIVSYCIRRWKLAYRKSAYMWCGGMWSASADGNGRFCMCTFMSHNARRW